jgi:hypothetical protein
MKKPVLLIIILNLLVAGLNSQSVNVRGGVSLADDLYKLYVTKMPTDFIAGLHFGFTGEVPFSDSFYLNAGVVLIKKGTKLEIIGGEEKIKIRYLEIPVNVAYKYDFGTWKILVQTGPYMGIGLSARIRQFDDKEKIEFGPADDQYNRMDYGINLGCGVEIDRIQVVFSYGLGFPDLSNFNSQTIRNRIYTLSLVYSLND